MKTERDLLINAAIAAGKFPAERRDHYERLFAADPYGTIKLIRQLEPALGRSASQASQPTGYPESWLPELRKKKAALATRGGRPRRVAFDT